VDIYIFSYIYTLLHSFYCSFKYFLIIYLEMFMEFSNIDIVTFMNSVRR